MPSLPWKCGFGPPSSQPHPPSSNDHKFLQLHCFHRFSLFSTKPHRFQLFEILFSPLSFVLHQCYFLQTPIDSVWSSNGFVSTDTFPLCPLPSNIILHIHRVFRVQCAVFTVKGVVCCVQREVCSMQCLVSSQSHIIFNYQSLCSPTSRARLGHPSYQAPSPPNPPFA